IIFGAELQITLKARAGMFRALAFVTVRQQHRQPRSLLPLVRTRGHILIDDCLRDVSEIAKLRFPQHQPTLPDDGISALEAQHAGFRQGTIENFEEDRKSTRLNSS